MSTTTPDEGAQNAQPTEPEAVTTGHNADQVITTDESGTPTLEPVASAAEETPSEEAATVTEEAPGEQTQETEAQAADKTDAEILEWAEKKGLKINPENPNEVKLARMQLETDRKFHENRQIVSVPEPEEIPLTGDDANYDAIVDRLNKQEQVNYVKTWFDANPSAKDVRTELQQIASSRPWLSNMDDVYAHYLAASPSREADLKREGGKQALTNLAQKQSQVPPASGATNTGVYASNQQITPQNVYSLVDNHDQAWFEKNHKAISDAMAGKSQ